MQTDLSPFQLPQYQVEAAEQTIGVEEVGVEDDLQAALSEGAQEVAVVVKVVQAMALPSLLQQALEALEVEEVEAEMLV
jgi:hypothetical protein